MENSNVASLQAPPASPSLNWASSQIANLSAIKAAPTEGVKSFTSCVSTEKRNWSPKLLKSNFF